MQFFILYTMVMPKMPKYALKRSFLNVFLPIFDAFPFLNFLFLGWFSFFLKVVVLVLFFTM